MPPYPLRTSLLCGWRGGSGPMDQHDMVPACLPCGLDELSSDLARRRDRIAMQIKLGRLPCVFVQVRLVSHLGTPSGTACAPLLRTHVRPYASTQASAAAAVDLACGQRRARRSVEVGLPQP